MKTAIFLSVRDLATRLPGKVMLKIHGKPVIEHLVDRLKQARLPDMIVMTTSTHPDDAHLAEIAIQNGIEGFRGSEDDKLQRYLDAADKYGIDFITVVDGDDLFCDPGCIDQVITAFAETNADYIICQDLPLGATPFGVRVEALRQVCSLKAENDTEVWGGYFAKNKRFRSLELEVEKHLRRPELRMTLDYAEDFAFFQAVFDKLYQPGQVFGLNEIIQLLNQHPEIAAINQDAQKRYEQHLQSAAPVRFKDNAPELDIVTPVIPPATGQAARFKRSRELQEKSHRLIPGGAHTYSKGDDQFPLNSPGFIQQAQGCYAWDVDGNKFLDWGMGLRSVILGHAYPRVLEAVTAQLACGSNFTRPSPIELELAELLIDLIPSAQMVKFAKNGSDVTSAAVRLARAYTGRDYIAVCKEHPFFSFYDWFIGTTPANAGIPQAVRDLSLTFHYNDIASLERLFAERPGQVACVIMEPVTTEPPKASFLAQVCDLAHANGAVVIFDEMISGFRWHLCGAQTFFNVTPDISTFGKALGNGFSVAALVGKSEIMELGGIKHDKPKVFLLSATHGAETHSLAASLTTLMELRDKAVINHIWNIGQALQTGFNALAAEMGLTDYVTCAGYPCSPYLVTKDMAGQASMPLRTLLLQELIAQDVLMPCIAISFSHTQREVDRTLEASAHALRIYQRALEERVDKYLVGPAVKPVFRKFN